MKVIAPLNFGRRRFRSSALWALVILLAGIVARGCLSQAPEFRPNLSIDVSTNSSTTEYYPLNNENKTIGNAKVWVEGLRKIHLNNSELVQIGLRIQNQSAQSIGVDVSEAEIEIETVDGRLLFEKAESYTGTTTISADKAGRLSMSFELPDSIDVDEIGAIDFNWTVESGTSKINNTTSFFRKSYQTHFSSFLFDPFWSSHYDWGCPANIVPYPPDQC